MGSIEILEEACEFLPHSTRAMFGGHGLFAPNGGMFAAVVDEDRIALKLARDEDRDAFLGEGAEPWTYQGRMTMRGWLVVPDALYDDPRALESWCRRAHATVEPKKAKATKGGSSKHAAPKGAAPTRAGPKKAPAKKAAPTKAAPSKTAPKRATPKAAAPKKAPARNQAPRKRSARKGTGKRAGGPRG